MDPEYDLVPVDHDPFVAAAPSSGTLAPYVPPATFDQRFDAVPAETGTPVLPGQKIWSPTLGPGGGILTEGQTPKTGQTIQPVDIAGDINRTRQSAVNVAGELTGVNDAARVASGEMPWTEAAAAALPMALGAPEVRAAEKIAAPAIREATAPLFDYSRLAEVPDVPQFDLERYVPPRGVPERTQELADRANVNRVNRVVKQGAQLGGMEWYNTDPLRQAFIEEIGPDKGTIAYQQYLDMVGATSPRSNVGVNARNASFYYQLAQRGQPLPERVRVGNNWTVAEPLPQPYGHVAQGLHVQNAQNVLENGGWPVLQNPKPASFVQNLAGNQQPVTVDTHNARLWGMTNSKGQPVDMPAPTEYGFMEQLQQRQAKKLGMSPAQYQASAWIGGGEETGLRSSADPFLKVFESRIAKTAEKLGLTKAQVLRNFIRGDQSLYGVGGAGIGAGALLDDNRPTAQ